VNLNLVKTTQAALTACLAAAAQAKKQHRCAGTVIAPTLEMRARGSADAGCLWGLSYNGLM